MKNRFGRFFLSALLAIIVLISFMVFPLQVSAGHFKDYVFRPDNNEADQVRNIYNNYGFTSAFEYLIKNVNHFKLGHATNSGHCYNHVAEVFIWLTGREFGLKSPSGNNLTIKSGSGWEKIVSAKKDSVWECVQQSEPGDVIQYRTGKGSGQQHTALIIANHGDTILIYESNHSYQNYITKDGSMSGADEYDRKYGSSYFNNNNPSKEPTKNDYDKSEGASKPKSTVQYCRIRKITSSTIKSNGFASYSGFNLYRNSNLKKSSRILNECEEYPSYCSLRTTQKTYMKSLPCSEDSDPLSENVFSGGIASGVNLTATKLYKNKWGKYWYYCTYNGKSGYILSDHTSLVELKYDNLSTNGINEPEDVCPIGYSFTPIGTISSKYNIIYQISIAVGKYEDIGGSSVLQIYTLPEDVNAYSFNISNATASKLMPDNTKNLSAGNYAYEILVTVSNNYVKDGVLKESHKGFTVKSKSFTIDSSSPESSVYSTLTLKDPTITESYVKVFAPQTVTNGSLNDTTQIGIRLYDESGNLLIHFSETPKTYSSNAKERPINYTIGTGREVDYPLSSNMTYKYVVYAIVNGIEFDSPVGSFTTLPASPSNMTSTITLREPTITSDYVKVYGPQTVENGSLNDTTLIGIRIFDDEGTLIKVFSEKPKTYSSSAHERPINYTIGTNKEVDLTLERGAIYQYEIFAVVGGAEFSSERGSFRNTAGIEVDYSQLNITDITVDSAILAFYCTLTGTTNSEVSRVSFLLFDDTDNYIDEVFVDESQHSGNDSYFSNTSDPYRISPLAPDTSYIVRVSSVISDIEFVSDPVTFTTLTCQHTYGDWQTEYEATCFSFGQEYRICTVCGISDSRSVDKIPHSYNSSDPETENYLQPTCTLSGSYDSVIYCNVCEEEISRTSIILQPLGHDFGEWFVTTEPTCVDAGERTRFCSRCDATETEQIDALGQNYTAVVTAPTCTDQGYTTFTCPRCGDSYISDYVSPLGHSFGEWVVTTPATEATEGVETRTCVRCGATETRAIPKLDPLEDPDMPKLVISKIEKATPGKTVTVNVSVENNPGFSSFIATINYDTSRLTLDSVALAEGIGGQFNVARNVAWINSSDFTGDGVFMTLMFTVKEDAEEGDAFVTIAYEEGDISNHNEADVNFAAVDGYVHVIPYIPGDINGDGKVNSKDLTRLLKYVSGENVTVNEAALDVNGDGKVNSKDLTRLLKYVSGEDVEIF